MINVRLGRLEAERGQLPDACMRCPAKATVWKKRSFVWQPSWIAVLIVAGLLPYVLVSLMLQKRMTAQVPLCEEHRSHYSKRIWFHLIVLAVAGLFAFLLFVVPSLLDLSENVKGQIMGGGCLFGAVFALVWLIATAIINSRMIGPAEITDNSITLKNVHPSFQEALARFRLQDDDDDSGRAPSAPKAPRPPQRPDQFYDPRSKNG